MKRLVAFAVAMTVLLLRVTALADATAVTDPTETTTTVTGAGDYLTVLLTESENNIVYVNQDNSTFDTSVDFLMKTNHGYG